jgi:Mrp family chromosome partitioning ATPase
MGALINGDTYRPAPLKIDTTPPAVPVPQPRSVNARTRASDRLPAAPTLPAPVPVVEPEAAPAAAPSVEALAPSVDEIATALQQAGEGGRRVAVIGSAREVGTTLTAIALARSLARNSRVVLVDLALASPNIDVISSDPAAPGIAELVRGTASFGDIITRDRGSRAHLVGAGQVGNDAAGLLNSQMLWAAIGALAQSYDHLVIDVGAQSDAALEPVAATAPYVVLVGGETSAAALQALAGQIQSVGFTEVMVLTGPPPTLEQAAVQSAA